MFNTATVLTNSESRDVLRDDDRLVITKVLRRKHLTTAERVAAFRGQEVTPTAEADWGTPVGYEVW
jgi:hypothetical protein